MKTILSPMTDIIFKLLFGTENSIEILTDFLLAVLKLSPDEYEDITITNPFLLQEYKGDKLGIVDVRLKLKTGKVIHIEVQVDPEPFMESRIVFYVSKLITEQINEGDRFEKIKRVISIIIADHPLIKNSDKYHHHFGLYDIESGVLFTDILEIHTLELPKAREINEDTENTDLLNWMKFLDVKTEEELNMLSQTSPIMKKAALRLAELSADEKARQAYEERLNLERVINTRLWWAEKQARVKFAKNLLRRNRPIDEIAEDTGLTHEEIAELQAAE